MFKKITVTASVVLFSLIFGFGFTQGVPSVTQTQFMTPPNDLRNFRYCTIISAFRQRLTVKIDVYNTMSLNDCPEEAWDALDLETLKDSYGATEIIMNGPRFWVVNEIQDAEGMATGQIVDFGSIEMQLIRQFEVNILQGVGGSEFYETNEVEINTNYLYYAGNTVYELTSPEGDVYRMQSYSQMIDANLTVNDLENLATRLALPNGWTYEARVLTEDSVLNTDGLAIVINDELGNTYQKIF